MKHHSDRLREELKQVRQNVQRRCTEQKLNMSSLQLKAERTRKKLDALMNEIRSLAALPLYLDSTRKNHQYDAIPPYVLAIETELLRHLHQMCILRKQLHLLSGQSEDFISTAKVHLVKLTDESLKTEVQLLSDIYRVDRERTDSEESFIKKLNDSQDELSLFKDEDDPLYRSESSRPLSPISSILLGINNVLSSNTTKHEMKTSKIKKAKKGSSRPTSPFSFLKIEKSPESNKIKHRKTTSDLTNLMKNNFSTATSHDARSFIVQI